MADGTYEYGMSLSRSFDSKDVRVLILNNTGTPVFDPTDGFLSHVLERPGNVEEPGTRDKVVPTRTVNLSTGTLDHADIVYTTPAAGSWVAAVYYIKTNKDTTSPVLYFRDAVAAPTGIEDVTLGTGVSGLAVVALEDLTRIRTDDENAPHTSRIRYADLNRWEVTDQALTVTAV